MQQATQVLEATLHNYFGKREKKYDFTLLFNMFMLLIQKREYFIPLLEIYL